MQSVSTSSTATKRSDCRSPGTMEVGWKWLPDLRTRNWQVKKRLALMEAIRDASSHAWTTPSAIRNREGVPKDSPWVVRRIISHPLGDASSISLTQFTAFSQGSYASNRGHSILYGSGRITLKTCHSNPRRLCISPPLIESKPVHNLAVAQR